MAAARAAAGDAAAASVPGSAADAVPVTRLRAGDVSEVELVELLSPSLFAEERVVVLEAADEAGKGPVDLIVDAAKEPPEGITLVIEHSGGGRAKSMVAALKKVGAQIVEVPAVTTAREYTDFARAEFRAAGVRVSGEVVDLLVDSVGKDLRELSAAITQLVADTGGRVDIAAVNRYYAGRAEVTGFEIADRAVAGETAAAMEALRWAQHRGVPHVLIADALADAVHSIARVKGLGRTPDQYKDAGALGMAPWKVKKVTPLARRWSSDRLAHALHVVAAVNADVKGQAVDPDYALENAVRSVSSLAG
ncbi:DNA polymerase III subunit delta [Tsukamurella soli]|uniref:DNA-directed DNA polymerase n=1 Tax=Tsukamurella soli TaxID=644556 RepID=A0ABP8KEG7_9ACTN